MEFILGLYDQDKSNSNLFEYVVFSNLSKEIIDQFILTFDIENLDIEIWKSICRRLSQISKIDEKCNKNRYRRYKGKETRFEIDSNNKFNGILKYLSDKTGGNIVDNGTVSITSNSATCPVKNLIIFDSTEFPVQR